ncbi:MAG: site-specific DNA-methyltransferase [Bacteroides sp.]|jgi:adenine-specific DNA-methyltransferase|nr:site-specific DNA-methyltransferase [Bacteroides sp.]
MDNLNQFKELEKLLRNESRYCTEDGHLLKNAIVEAALAMRPDLLRLLLSHKALRKNFFTEVDGLTVFDKVKFQKFVMNKRFLPDSYTCFKNKVGITDASGDNFLSESREVVLSWPYKDCMLEGGQTKEDAKRNEVFWNEILAPDEINRLTEPKALNNFRRYDADGEHEVTSVSKDDNFIIKGNNLLALYSLYKNRSVCGKVKLIYIDPPYNTGNDGFGYNDNFNQSTWLTFMRNRLLAAKRLLSSDGVICVQCSFHEYGYLKVLMDEIFEKSLCTFNILVRHPDRILTGDKEFNDVIEYNLIYSVSSETKMPKKIEQKLVDDYVYKIVELGEPEVIYFDEKKVEIFTPEKYSVAKEEPNEMLSKTISVRGSIREKNSSGRLYVKFIEPIAANYPPETIFKVENMGDDNFGFRRFYTPPKGNKNGGYYQGKPTSSDVTEKPYPNFFDFQSDYNNVNDEGNVSFRNGKKPEEYIGFLISIFTKENDIILDYHLGSGTTAAVAHKMGRRYIGVEQMDYIQTVAVERLKKVIEGEQGGTSKAVNWQGGGSFVYCELATANQQFVDSIENATSTAELQTVWTEMQATGFLSWKVKPQEIDENIKEFAELSLDEQKRFLIECLDKNLLYVPYSEINNEEFGISKNDKSLNSDFYTNK